MGGNLEPKWDVVALGACTPGVTRDLNWEEPGGVTLPPYKEVFWARLVNRVDRPPLFGMGDLH